MAARAQDLATTRDLLRDILARKGRAVMSGTDAARALAVDEKTLRHYGDAGLIDYVRKGRVGRAYTIEAVVEFLARGGVPANHAEGEECRSISPKGRASTTTDSSAEVVSFTARHTAPPAAPPRK